MNLEDIEIDIKKYDRVKNVVIVNLFVSKLIEIRGFIVRYTPTEKSPNQPVWIVNPPSIPVKGKSKFKTIYFHVIRFKDLKFWYLLQEEIVRKVIDYTNI